MFNFLKMFFFIFIFLKITPHEIESDFSYFSSNKSFLPFFIFFIYLNYLSDNHEKTNINIDLLFKYLLLMFKTPNFFLNYIVNIFKKIYIYLVHFKYKHIYNSLKIFIKKYSLSIFIWWRPLFKKSSYFGYYRSNRSKWIK